MFAWGDNRPNNAFVFDGPGGCIAQASASRVCFDDAERWVLSQDSAPAGENGGERKPGIAAGQARARNRGAGELARFVVLPVAVHELGHALALIIITLLKKSGVSHALERF